MVFLGGKMDIQDDLIRFEQNLNELIIKYDQYFLGLEKREPTKLLEEAERFARKYQPAHINNAMNRFKYTNLIGRLNSYRQLWNKTLRLLEEGKISRGSSLRARTTRKKTARPDSAAPSEIQQIFRDYIEARRDCGLPVDAITPDLIAEAIATQKPAIVEKYRCDTVEFRVVVEGGAPRIKARPKS
jgi:hypothetical protein